LKFEDKLSVGLDVVFAEVGEALKMETWKACIS